MKTHRFVAAALLGGLIMFAASCGKKQDPAAPVEKKQTAATNAVSSSLPAAGTNAAFKTTPAAVGTASNEAARLQSLVDGAKKAFAEGKWQDALTKLTQLSNLDLTNLPPEQASAFYEQMEQLEKAAREAVTKPLTK